MSPVVAEKKEVIEQLCRAFHVHRLSLFGSATRDDFNPEKSDLDFLVEFQSENGRKFEDYMNMKEKLENTFHRPVDLIERSAIENSRNYIRRKHILNSLEVIYVER